MKMMISSIFLAIILLLVNVGNFNADAYVNVEVDQKEMQKMMCEGDYEAEWKDGKCHFSGKDKNFDEREYEFDLRDVGAYDGYAERNNLKENSLKNQLIVNMILIEQPWIITVVRQKTMKHIKNNAINFMICSKIMLIMMIKIYIKSISSYNNKNRNIT